MALTVPIVADTAGLVRGLGRAQGRLRTFGKVAALAAGAAGIGAMVQTLRIGTAEFMEQQKVAAQTGAVLKSTGSIANVTAEQMEKLSGALMKKSGVDDEAIQSGQNLLLTFTKIRNETGKGNDIFDQATVAMLDLSVAMGKDLNSSAILVGKALNDPVKGATALSRAGVQLTKGQKDQIEAFVESGRVLEAQKIILGELTTQFGGSAEAAGKTLPGQLNILKQTFSNLAGELAGRFLPSLARAATKLTDFLLKFAAAPTLKAKVELVTGSIDNAFQRIRDWWTTGDRKELPARVDVRPPGKQQVDDLIAELARNIDRGLKKKGDEIGFALAEAIFGGAKRGAKQKGEQAGNSIVANLFVNVPGIKLGIRLGGYVLDGFERYFSTEGGERGGGIIDAWVQFMLDAGLGPLYSLGRRAADEFNKGASDGVKRPRKGQASLANSITAQVREAIQSARQSLIGGAATLGGLVGEIIGGSSAEAVRLREIRAQQQREAREREDARLREAVANAQTADERAIAERDLQSFLLEQEAIRLEESIQQNQEAANKNIANLVEEFNRGLISADVFSARLNEIIGADRGAELGLAFAGAFDRELQTILNTARDIFSVIGTGETIAGATGAGVSTTLKAENERRFQEALADWQKRRDALTQRLERATDSAKDDDSPGGKSITDAEKKGIATIRNLIEAHKKRRPNRGAYGLALGGILKQPTFVAGEAGKEAVIPLESSSAMDILRQAVGGGGGSTQVINLTVNAGLGTNPDELSRVIVDSIKYYERRNGQVFTGPLVPTVRTASGSLVQAASSGPTDFNRISQRRRG